MHGSIGGMPDAKEAYQGERRMKSASVVGGYVTIAIGVLGHWPISTNCNDPVNLSS
jgi:hypothetical protein